MGEGLHLSVDTSNEGYLDLEGDPPAHIKDQPLTPACPRTAGVTMHWAVWPQTGPLPFLGLHVLICE